MGSELREAEGEAMKRAAKTKVLWRGWGIVSARGKLGTYERNAPCVFGTKAEAEEFLLPEEEGERIVRVHVEIE